MDNTYLSIALNDYEYAIQSGNSISGFYNNKVCIYQQVCEKLLKHIVVEISADKSLLRSRSLQKIYEAIKSEIVLSEKSELSLALLTSFYFDARYPGDDFVNVSQRHCELALDVMKEVHDKVLEWETNRKRSKGAEAFLKAARSVNNM